MNKYINSLFNIYTEEEKRRLSPSFAATVEQEELAERAYRLQVEDESRRQHELWLWHEEMFKEKQKKKAEQLEREKQLRLEMEVKWRENMMSISGSSIFRPQKLV